MKLVNIYYSDIFLLLSMSSFIIGRCFVEEIKSIVENPANKTYS